MGCESSMPHPIRPLSILATALQLVHATKRKARRDWLTFAST